MSPEPNCPPPCSLGCGKDLIGVAMLKSSMIAVVLFAGAEGALA